MRNQSPCQNLTWLTINQAIFASAFLLFGMAVSENSAGNRAGEIIGGVCLLLIAIFSQREYHNNNFNAVRDRENFGPQLDSLALPIAFAISGFFGGMAINGGENLEGFSAFFSVCIAGLTTLAKLIHICCCMPETRLDPAPLLQA